mmetsp:Transcript_31162/g.81717  ORF Transcript_31162/g.81717 Transcript_31162/m.81717 type:complete len:202 (-) Transcript_31162:101-706(-)
MPSPRRHNAGDKLVILEDARIPSVSSSNHIAKKNLCCRSLRRQVKKQAIHPGHHVRRGHSPVAVVCAKMDRNKIGRLHRRRQRFVKNAVDHVDLPPWVALVCQPLLRDVRGSGRQRAHCAQIEPDIGGRSKRVLGQRKCQRYPVSGAVGVAILNRGPGTSPRDGIAKREPENVAWGRCVCGRLHPLREPTNNHDADEKRRV